MRKKMEILWVAGMVLCFLALLFISPKAHAHVRHHMWHPKVAAIPPSIPQIAHFRGLASYYSRAFNGRKTACGVTFQSTMLIAASRTLPCGSILQVTNLRNGRHMNVTVLDRGPYVGGRILDVSETVANSLGFVHSGTAEIDVQLLH